MGSTARSGQYSAAAPGVGFRRHLRVEVAGDEKVYLFGERGLTVLAGSTVSAVASLLDGSRDLAALLAAAADHVGEDQVAGVLARLAELNVLALRPAPAGADDGTDTADDAALAYWDGVGLDAAAAATATATSTVAVTTVGDPAPTVGRTRAVDTLRAAGLTVLDGIGSADLTVVLCDDYLNPALADVDAAHRAAGRPWLLAKPAGAIVWLGPVFTSDRPGCWHCLAHPLAGHRDAETCAQQALGHAEPVRCPACTLPALAGTALHMVALAATQWLAGHRDPNQGSVWTFDSTDLTGRHHVVRPRPQCPACGDPELTRRRAWQPVTLAGRTPIADTAGGHRALTCEQVRDRYQHLVSPVTGVVKEIRRDEHGPAFFHSYLSGANMATRARDLGALRASLRNSNGGKGTTAIQAEVGALCEAVERYSGSWHGDEERVRGSLRSLGEDAVHPNACQLVDPRQYAHRAEWNAAHGPFQAVGAPFDEDAETDWTPVWSLTHGRHRLLPTGLLYFGAPVPAGTPALLADSNGNAAGAGLADAVLQGIFEVVERDAVALWWYNRGRVPGVDLAAFADPWVDELRTVYTGLGRDVWVLDVTADLGVPTMAALSRRVGAPAEDIMFGFGAHLDPAIALRRALSELNQLLPAVGSGGEYRCTDPDALRWWRHATTANQPYLLPDPAGPLLGPSAYRPAPCDDIGAEVDLLRRRLAERDMDLLVLDQTRPDIGLPVVKVIVPGMRPFWTRFAPGRLFDVPVALGRQATPTGYADLNPFPLFL
ncbi:MAG TPA: TOMM precursor leader peptide-binding protein [Pseudonocardiaceae bacterium]|jgi:ribosomal protein S12 methylthiotransferase accessory factor